MKKKLQIDDDVLVVEKSEKQKRRKFFNSTLDVVEAKTGNKIKLKKLSTEDVDEDGVDASGKSHILKVQKKFLKFFKNAIRGNINKISLITIDKQLYQQLLRENDNE